MKCSQEWFVSRTQAQIDWERFSALRSTVREMGQSPYQAIRGTHAEEHHPSCLRLWEQNQKKKKSWIPCRLFIETSFESATLIQSLHRIPLLLPNTIYLLIRRFWQGEDSKLNIFPVTYLSVSLLSFLALLSVAGTRLSAASLVSLDSSPFPS